MPKLKNLNGLPHNLIKSFFGTERYYICGYMADWLFNAAEKLQLKEATIDVLKQNIYPPELNLHPLIVNLKDLHSIIDKELKANGFPPDFIAVASFRVEFLYPTLQSKILHCFPTFKDKEGHTFGPERIIEEAYERPFDPFDHKLSYPYKPSFFDKLKSIFK